MTRRDNIRGLVFFIPFMGFKERILHFIIRDVFTYKIRACCCLLLDMCDAVRTLVCRIFCIEMHCVLTTYDQW